MPSKNYETELEQLKAINKKRSQMARLEKSTSKLDKRSSRYAGGTGHGVVMFSEASRDVPGGYRGPNGYRGPDSGPSGGNDARMSSRMSENKEDIDRLDAQIKDAKKKNKDAKKSMNEARRQLIAQRIASGKAHGIILYDQRGNPVDENGRRLTRAEVQERIAQDGARSRRSLAVDNMKTAKKVYPSNPTPAMMDAYLRESSRADMVGIDCPRGTKATVKPKTSKAQAKKTTAKKTAGTAAKKTTAAATAKKTAAKKTTPKKAPAKTSKKVPVRAGSPADAAEIASIYRDEINEIRNNCMLDTRSDYDLYYEDRVPYMSFRVIGNDAYKDFVEDYGIRVGSGRAVIRLDNLDSGIAASYLPRASASPRSKYHGPYERMSSQNHRILRVYYDPFREKIDVLAYRPDLGLVIGRDYNPMTGIWQGGDYNRTREQIEDYFYGSRIVRDYGDIPVPPRQEGMR